jgi:glutamate racemase
MKIGVFDSGVGGLAVAKAIQRALPEHDVVLKEDREHLPYGTKSPEQLYAYVVPVLEALVKEGCGVIVVACNTVSTTIVDRLRDTISVPLIAMEPMVKPAAQLTASGVIAVCATPTTLKSKRYKELKHLYAKGVKVIEPDCSGWAMMVETNQLDRESITREVNGAIAQGADVIVLGCTHYHWIEDEIKALAGGQATVIQPEPAVIAQLKRVLTLIT